MSAVTDQAERYDRIAAGYAQWWAPVLEPRATALLDRLDGAVCGRCAPADRHRHRDRDARPSGASPLAVRSRSSGSTLSSGMAAAAEAEADRLLAPAERRRFDDPRRAAPTSCRFPDGGFDAAISSFVLQLVPNRFRAIREALPGPPSGRDTRLRHVARRRPRIPAGRRVRRAARRDRIGAREPDDRPGDIPDRRRCRRPDASRRLSGGGGGAGDCSSTPSASKATFGFLVEFDEEDLIASLSRAERAAPHRAAA